MGRSKERAYFFNINLLRHNQFDFWPQMSDECLGKVGYFVEFTSLQEAPWALKRFQEKLKVYFSEVTILPPQLLYKDQKVAIIVRASGYNGKMPSSTNKY